MPKPNSPPTRRTSWTPNTDDDAAVAIVAAFMRDRCGTPFPSYTDSLRYALKVAADVLRPETASTAVVLP